MKSLMEKIGDNINTELVITVVSFIFLLGVSYATFTHKVDNIEARIIQHTDIQYRPLRARANETVERVIQIETNYENLREILRRNEQNQNERYERIEERLIYIIDRIDENNRTENRQSN